MSYIHSIDLRELPLYFAYQRSSYEAEHYPGTFHAHQGIEILYIHQGKGTLILEQKSYELSAGILCIFQPYQLHHVQVEISPDMPFIRSIVHFEPHAYEAYFEKWPSLHAFFKQMHTSKLAQPCIYNAGEHELLLNLLRDWNETLPRLSRNEYFEEISLFLLAFLRILKQLWERQTTRTTTVAARNMHHAERILEWLELHYKEPLRLEDMASELHLSPYHLSHLFKDCTGSSISDYITAKKTQQAILLLTATRLSISRIGEEIGITSCSYFCKLFKSQTGITPHQYRKQFQQKIYPQRL
ncbi:AraC family transcriptional regulator [Paenibacillus alkaliterrae]|uniref:AraC family transcriptional regulator n=1 Tax=Paenibacillus alkaliterrae TaxID=320909 RepID=UPI001F270B0F|nr:AraC family transcriptional regulator [Paenibacillus alkaliterrae]MCF2937800.1 AraC family transcriptional regulator [Paenibacillus alkaliterrae]